MPSIVHRSQDRATDKNGEAIATMVFSIDLRPEAAAEEYLMSQLGFGYESPYPGDDTLICDAIQAAPEADGRGTVLTLKFSTTGRYTFLQNPRDRKYIRFTKSWQKVDRKVPVYIRYSHKVPSKTDPGSNIIAYTWQVEWVTGPQMKQEVVEIEADFVISSPLQFQRINAIGDQQDKLHKFNSSPRLYRFEAGPVQHVGPENFTCRYSWVGDLGTPRTASMIDDAETTWPETLPGGLIRLPHHEWIVGRVDPDTSPLPFIFRNWLPYDDSNLEGWKSLPGLPASL